MKACFTAGIKLAGDKACFAAGVSPAGMKAHFRKRPERHIDRS